MLVLAVLALVLVWALVAVSQAAWWAEPGSARGLRSARPQVECLEGRWVPATFQWTPQKNSTDGGEAYNWTCITDGTQSVPPSDGTATLAFSSGYKNGNNSCNLTGTNYSTISTNSGYLGTITLKGATTVGSAYLSGGNLNTAGASLTVTKTGTIGTAANATPAFSLTGAGELDVNAGAAVTLDNASLDASVRVTNGTVNVGQLTFAGAGTNRWFIVSGPQGVANFGNTAAGTLGAYTSSYKFPPGGAAVAYLQPVVVQNGGSLNFNNNYSANGFIFNRGGNVNVNSPLTINGDSGNAPQTAGLAPAGVAAGYISVGSKSNLFVNATTLAEVNQNPNGAQNFAAYL